jgi:hypothetical protein
MDSAAGRTREIKKILRDAGYVARVTSSPVSHRAQVTTVSQCEDLIAVASYLQGYLGWGTAVSRNEGFVSVTWPV